MLPAYSRMKYSIKATSFAGIYVDGDRERIPCNTRADIYLPVKGKVRSVMVNGQKIQKVKLIDGYVIFKDMGSGIYQFEIEFGGN